MKPDGGIHKKGRSHLSFLWTWPQLLQAVRAPRSWKALRHSTLEFSPYLPLFASRYIGGTARAFPALVGHSKAAT